MTKSQQVLEPSRTHATQIPDREVRITDTTYNMEEETRYGQHRRVQMADVFAGSIASRELMLLEPCSCVLVHHAINIKYFLLSGVW